MKSKFFFKNFFFYFGVLRNVDIQTYSIFCVSTVIKIKFIYVQRGTIAHIWAIKSGSSGFALPFFRKRRFFIDILAYPRIRQLLFRISLMNNFFSLVRASFDSQIRQYRFLLREKIFKAKITMRNNWNRWAHLHSHKKLITDHFTEHS